MSNNQVIEAENEMYKATCALDDCDQVLHIDMPIHIWDNNKTGDDWEEMTICDYCHNSITSDLYHSKGWTHDDEDEEEDDW